MHNILTFDIEDYFQVSNFLDVIKKEDWNKYEIRVEENTDKILDILSNANVKATFFILGWVAEKLPHLVRKIHRASNEISSHGYEHQLIYNQTPDEFRNDIRKSKIILEDIIQEPVLGYRAPTYSITRKSVWAIDILMEEGFKYDSSFFPIHHDKGGITGVNRFPHKIYNHNSYIWEFPISTIKILKQNLPFSGGGYFRLLPYLFINSAIKKINKGGYPIIIYMHPWEFDLRQPKIKTNCLNSFRHYINISRTGQKLKQLLKDFEFKTVKEFIEEYKD